MPQLYPIPEEYYLMTIKKENEKNVVKFYCMFIAAT